MTIVEFINARLDDDEAYARSAFADHNDAGPEWSEPWSGGVLVSPREDPILTFDSGVSRHMVRQDPARVLREVAAKRRIIERCEQLARIKQGEPQGIPDAELLRNDLVLQQFASVYSDHPEFDQAWAS